MRVVVIGGSEHVGTFLVPRLVEAGHGVVSISRGQREPYQVHPAWQSVEQVTLDREAEEAEGTFGERVLGLEPDVVVDMICFTPESARQLVAALRGRISHFLHCGTIWVHGTAQRCRPPRVRRAVLSGSTVSRRPGSKRTYSTKRGAVDSLLQFCIPDT